MLHAFTARGLEGDEQSDSGSGGSRKRARHIHLVDAGMATGDPGSNRGGG